MIALKNLVAERTRLILSVVGVAFAVLLMLVMAGIFVGTARQVTTYIDHSRNAVWVMQPGVSQMFKAVSWLPADGRQKLTDLPEVASADPILGLPSDFVHNGTHTAYFVLGYDTGTGVGGPWSLSAGRDLSEPGEAVMDRILAARNGIRLGDTVRIVDGDFTVVGLSDQTAAATNYYTFISLDDAAGLLRAADRVSYFLVQPEPGYSDEQVVRAIGAGIPGMTAMTSAAFAENSRDIVVTMIGRPLKTMIGIAAIVGIVLIGLTAWALAGEQMGDFAVLRALGVRPGQLWRAVLGQGAAIAGLGYLLGAAIAYGAELLLGDRMGDIAIAITPGIAVSVAAGTAVMAALGTVLPGRRLARIDPAAAFRH